MSSYPPISFGSPALGYTNTGISAIKDNSDNQGRISFAPRAQLSPIAAGFACRTEFQNASTVCPDKVLPLASVIVPEMNIGISHFRFSNKSNKANKAALQLSVSNTVSTKNRSTPPSKSPRACSLYAEARSSKVIFRYPGLFTSGLMDAVRLVGPIAPATYLGSSVNLLAAVFAISTALRFIS